MKSCVCEHFFLAGSGKTTDINISKTRVMFVEEEAQTRSSYHSGTEGKLQLQITTNMGQGRLYILRGLRSFNICKPLLCTFYQTAVASALVFGMVCLGKGSYTADRKRVLIIPS